MPMQQTDKRVSLSPIPGYHPVTRWLHAGLVLGVVFQLVCASLMAHPEHTEGKHGMAVVAHAEAVEAHHSGHNTDNGFIIGSVAHVEAVTAGADQPIHKKDALGEWLMSAHRTGGILLALIVLANLLWAVMPRGNPRKRQLAVLFSALHWSEAWAIATQLPSMLAGKKPLPEPGNSLSLIFEMFGLLTMTAMAITGSMIWSLWSGPGSRVSEQAELWMETHAGIAVLLFLYLAGHISMAWMHARAGDPVFTRILPLEKMRRIFQVKIDEN